MRHRRLPAVLMGLTLPFALFPVTGANGATAQGTCYGERCDWKDPIDTNCIYGAYIPKVRGAVVDAFGGRIELHYGPGWEKNGFQTCQVNWARFVKRGQGDDYRVWVERHPSFTGKASTDKRRTAYDGGDEGTGIIYSDQVYAGTSIKARACVERAIPVRRLAEDRVGAASTVLCTAFI